MTPRDLGLVDPRFRSVLKGLVAESGLTLVRIAELAHISRPMLSMLLNGDRSPTDATAAALDRALGTDGDLAAMVGYGPGEARDLIAAAAANPRHVTPATVASLAGSLAAQRRLDDVLGASHLIASVTAQVRSITAMVREVTGPERPELMYVAAQWAQFLGWLHISTARWEGARGWLATALEWAVEVGQPDLMATTMSYQGHLAWLQHEPGPAIGLSEAAARAATAWPGQRAYDLYAAARGYAAIHDQATAELRLAQADQAADDATRWTGDVPPWEYYRAPWMWRAEHGLVLLHMARWDSGQAARAAEELAAGVAAIPVEMAGADWLAEFVVHQGIAHQLAGDQAEAAAVFDRAAGLARQTGSARVLKLIAARQR